MNVLTFAGTHEHMNAELKRKSLDVMTRRTELVSATKVTCTLTQREVELTPDWWRKRMVHSDWLSGCWVVTKGQFLRCYED